jgi:hypothetical protein
VSTQKLLSKADVIRNHVNKAIETLRASNQVFEHAYYTYTQQYGNVISVCDPLNLVDTIDPVIMIFGRNTSVKYSNSKKSLSGSVGSIELRQGSEYIIGRRQPQDSTLVIWGPNGEEVELEMYNPEAGVIPSRVHAAIVYLDEAHLFFSDLTSSSGTILVGETKQRGPFICVYDPGSVEFPSVKLDWISTERMQ